MAELEGERATGEEAPGSPNLPSEHASSPALKVNSGSPVGPGFVVYDRGPGKYGYTYRMALQSVGKGWRPLLRDLFWHLRENYSHHRVTYKKKDRRWHCEQCPQVVSRKQLGKAHDTACPGAPYAIQVKEKWGALRVYIAGGDEYLLGYISGLETASKHLCEHCGQRGRLRNDRSWIVTACDTCNEEYLRRQT